MQLALKISRKNPNSLLLVVRLGDCREILSAFPSSEIVQKLPLAICRAVKVNKVAPIMLGTDLTRRPELSFGVVYAGVIVAFMLQPSLVDSIREARLFRV
jgi:hypothetical protein